MGSCHILSISQVAVYSKLESDERFLESFKRSIGYVKLLAELDLLKDPSAKSEAGDDDRISTGDSNSLSGEILDENSSGVQPSCLSIYGDRLSLNSYDSANYSYDSTGAISTNDAGNIVENTNFTSSTDKLDAISGNREPKSLPVLSASKIAISDYDNGSQHTLQTETSSIKKQKIRHRRYTILDILNLK